MSKKKSAVLMTAVYLLLIAAAVSTIILLTSRNRQQAHANGSGDQPNFEHDYSKDYLIGNFNPSEDPRFVVIEDSYADKTGMYLREEAYQAFLEMRSAASQAGHSLTIVSATRNFFYQGLIWSAKWNGDRLVNGQDLSQTLSDPKERALAILRYSSMPGTSRHHWGTDIDINSLRNSYFESGEGLAVYEWLTANANDYGFYIVYTEKGEGRSTGYEQEKWHWSYLPLALEMIHQYTNKVSYEDITGFDGAEVAEEVGMIENYVMGINPVCYQLPD